MKKLTVILLLLTLLVGCAAVPDETLPHTTGADTAAGYTSGDEPATVMPMVTVSLPASSEETLASDGTVLSRSVSQSMSLVIPEAEVADDVILDFLSRVDSISTTAESTAASAESAYTGGDWTPYLCSLLYSPMRIDQSVLSLYGSMVVFTGSAHPEQSCTAANYNLLTGEVLTLGSILESAQAHELLCQLVTEALDEIAEKKYLRSDYEDAVAQRFAREESYDEDWYFSSEGLCFYFAPYELAPYSSGVIIAQVPYGKLSGILADAFFPPEQDAPTGSVVATDAVSADIDSFDRISELLLVPDAQSMLLYTSGTVRNLRITAYDPAAASTYTAFAAEYLGSTDAVMIEAPADQLEALSLVYESGGATVTVPLKEITE